jgi:hypothetical protein
MDLMTWLLIVKFYFFGVDKAKGWVLKITILHRKMKVWSLNINKELRNKKS